MPETDDFAAELSGRRLRRAGRRTSDHLLIGQRATVRLLLLGLALNTFIGVCAWVRLNQVGRNACVTEVTEMQR